MAGTNAVGRDEPPSLFADGGLMHESALPGPTLFVGEQPIYHTLGSSAALLEGFVPEIPAPTDAIWFAVASDFPDVQQARADFDASGVEAIQLDVSALLAEGERRRKRITDVEIVVESRTLPNGTEGIQYLVKLTVENCTEANFAGFGAGGASWPPSVFVGEAVADQTFFSLDEQVVVGEFDDEREDGAEITLRYAYMRLTAPEPFQLP